MLLRRKIFYLACTSFVILFKSWRDSATRSSTRRSVCNIINIRLRTCPTERIPYRYIYHIAVYMCSRVCVYQFSEKLLTWIPRVSVGRSIFLTPVEVGTVASTAASFPRHLKRKFTGRKIFFHELIGWLSDKWIVRVINRKKVSIDETVLYDARNDDTPVHRNATYNTYISDRGYLFYTPARCAVVRRDRSLLKSIQQRPCIRLSSS